MLEGENPDYFDDPTYTTFADLHMKRASTLPKL